MGGGLVPAAAAGRAAEYKGRVTWYVLITAVIASSGGLLFGYDLGVTGGVEASPTFLALFFPGVAARKREFKHSSDGRNPYCEYDSPTMSLFTSSLFLAAMCASLPASYVTRRLGRKASMVVGGLWYLLGGALSAGAQNLGMLVAGRIFLGFGVGFANGAVPIYLSEMAPSHARGALNILFQLATTTGVLTAQLVNYGLRGHSWGWRLSLGLACAPAALLALGGALLPDSPAGLMERGRVNEARRVLQHIRGTQDVGAELADIGDAAATAASVTQLQAFRNILTRREFSPQLALGVLIPTFQQWTGLNAIVFFVPQLFAALGSADDAALLNAVVIGGANVGGTLVSILLADRVGRRALLLQAGLQMAGALAGVAALVGVSLGQHPASALPKGTVGATLALVCVFVLGYSWSWGPMSWLIPSEIQTLETRSAGFSISVFVHFLMMFLLGQSFLPMMCSMQFGVFAFFAGMVVLATVFVWLCVPETKGIPLEEIYPLYAKHPLWRRAIGKQATAAALALERSNSGAVMAGRAESAATL